MPPRIRSAEKDKPAEGKPLISLFLDSGAFSAWTKGVSIDLDEYCDYIIKHKDLIAHYVNLDVIVHTVGSKRTTAMADEAARRSFTNYVHMKKRGLDPIPVVHFGEPYSWVQKYIDDGAKYIGLSPGTGDIAKTASIAWLDEMFTGLTDKDGWPKYKTHGFAVTGFDLMARYPWTTVDSTSWALTAAFGSIFVPVYIGGKADYSKPPIKMTVSRYEGRASMPTDHFDGLGPTVQARVREYLKELGVTIEEAREDYEVRARVVVSFMLKFEKALGDVRFDHRRHKGGLFG